MKGWLFFFYINHVLSHKTARAADRTHDSIERITWLVSCYQISQLEARIFCRIVFQAIHPVQSLTVCRKTKNNASIYFHFNTFCLLNINTKTLQTVAFLVLFFFYNIYMYNKYSIYFTIEFIYNIYRVCCNYENYYGKSFIYLRFGINLYLLYIILANFRFLSMFAESQK